MPVQQPKLISFPWPREANVAGLGGHREGVTWQGRQREGGPIGGSTQGGDGARI